MNRKSQVLYRLAVILGMMPDEVLANMTSEELTAWAIYLLNAA